MTGADSNRRAAVVALAVALSLLAASPAVGQEDVCADVGDGRAIVGALPNGDVLDGTAALYAGTELTVYFCDDGNANLRPDAWQLGDHDGFERVDSDSVSVTVQLTGEADSIDFVELERKIDTDFRGLTVQRPDVPRVDPSIANVDPSYVDSAEDEEAYQQREDELTAALANLNESRDDLRTLTDEVEADGLAAVGAENATDTIASVNASAAELGGAAADYRIQVATILDGQETPLVRLTGAATEREQHAVDEAGAALEAYLDALDARATVLRGEIRSNVLLALAVGLLLGLVAGAYVPYKEASNVKRKSRLSSSVAFTRRALAVPLVVGAVLLVVTLGALAAFGSLEILWTIL